MNSTPRSGVTILGSANMDTVFVVDRVPSPGETLLAESAALYAGGKGLNQAVAAARAGAAASFIAGLGGDAHGDALTGVMATDGIDRSRVRRVEEPTGQAFILVDGNGENSIIVAAGANGTVAALTEPDRRTIAEASVLLMQLEVPLGVVIEAAVYARSVGTTVMLNAAPAQPLPSALLESLDYLIVNEHEACLIAQALLGTPVDLDSASLALAAVVARVVVTLGSSGSALYDGGVEVARIPAPKVTSVDTTGAGDTFCGALAAAIDDDREFAAAAEFATVAAALSVQGLGAVPSIPHRAAIDAAFAQDAAAAARP
jgi:ribokinase